MPMSHLSATLPPVQRAKRGAFHWMIGIIAAALVLAALAFVQTQEADAQAVPIVPPTSQEQLDAAMAAWAANGSPDYIMSYRTSCTGCANDQLVTIVVEAGALLSAVDHLGNFISIVGVDAPEVFTIDGLFAKIQHAIDSGPYVQAQFHPVDGRPTNAFFMTGFPNVPPFTTYVTTHDVLGYAPYAGAGCHNRDVTVILTEGNDWFDSASLGSGLGNMVIASLGGDDTITTYGTRDFVCAGPGNDIVRSGDGNDVVAGNDGDDVLFGEWGDDLLIGGSGEDRLLGQLGADDLRGGPGRDEILGGRGADIVDGGGGGDRIWGGVGWDQLRGGSGPDRIWGDYGFDMIEGEAGNDRLYGGNHADELHGGDGNDFARGNGGNDLVNGEDGNDTVWGDGGTDLLYGFNGDDILDGGAGTDDCFPGPGADTTANCQVN